MCRGTLVTLESAESQRWLECCRKYLVQSPPKPAFLKRKKKTEIYDLYFMTQNSADFGLNYFSPYNFG